MGLLPSVVVGGAASARATLAPTSLSKRDNNDDSGDGDGDALLLD